MNTFKVKLGNTSRRATSFPFDMLQQDQCWPFAEADSKKLACIAISYSNWMVNFVSIGDSTITLASRGAPNRQAWIDHGWEVSWCSTPTPTPNHLAQAAAVHDHLAKAWYPEHFIDLMRREEMDVDHVTRITPQPFVHGECPAHKVEFENGNRYLMVWRGSHPIHVETIPRKETK